MKQLELNTEKGFDLMEKILPEVANILEDDDIKDVRSGIVRENDKISVRKNFLPVMSLFVGKRRESVIRIVAAVKGKSVEEVKEQPINETIEDFQQCMCEEMMVFFAACLRMVMIT